VYDQRGFGRSACKRDDVEVRYCADDLRAVLDAANIEQAAIVGHDLGAMAGLRLAIEYPERLCCLVVCSSAGGIISEKILRSVAARLSELTRGGPRDGMLLSPGFAERHPDLTFLQQQIFEMGEPVDAALMASAVEARVRIGELTGFATPTLVISGAMDQLFPSEAVLEAASLIPGAKSLEIPDVGHLPFFEQPELFNRVVGEFVDLHWPA
jgi:pimeloyl-ACP methyl ester carboxylesterase